MKGVLLRILVVVCIELNAAAVPVVLDLSRSHQLEDLKKSSLVIKAIAGGAGREDFSFENQEVEIHLPGGRIVRQAVVLGIVDSKKGLLTKLSITGGAMPQEQAFQIARLFQQSFDLPLDELNDWKKRNEGLELSSDRYGVSALLKYYPVVSLSIDGSINRLYPWVIRFEIEWGWKEHRDWNEERVLRELPAPALASISLNPPSGLKYDRREAYKEALEAQAKFEQELAAKGRASTPETNSSPASPKATPKPSPAVDAEPQNFLPWPWIIAILLFLAIVSGFMFKFLRK